MQEEQKLMSVLLSLMHAKTHLMVCAEREKECNHFEVAKMLESMIAETEEAYSIMENHIAELINQGKIKV